MADEEKALNGLKEIAGDRVVGCGYRAREHWYSRRAWQFNAYVLAVVAGVASALVATDLFDPDQAPLAGASPYLGAIAAVAVAITTVFDAQGKAAAHKAARAEFEGLVVGFRRFLVSTVYEGGFSDAKVAFDMLEHTHSRLQGTAPEPGAFAKWLARRAIKREEQRQADEQATTDSATAETE